MLYQQVTRKASVGIGTDYGLDGPVIESRRGRDFSHMSRPSQHPVQWVLGLSWGLSGRGVVLTTQPLLAPRLRMSRARLLLAL
jgi:hypothetical protein